MAKKVKNPYARGKARNYSRTVKPEAPLVVKPLTRPKAKPARVKRIPPQPPLRSN